MVYLKLLISFFKIGLFSFGGGYAMIPMIQNEIESNGWMSPTEFADIIAIAEMTPGPIAVNSATFVGYKVAGITGGLVATIGVSLPSLILILLVSRIFIKYMDHPVKNAIFYGVRPVICGLVLSAAFFIAETAWFNMGFDEFINSALSVSNLGDIINLKGIIITALSLFLLIKFKAHPILVLVISAVLGIVLFNYLK